MTWTDKLAVGIADGNPAPRYNDLRPACISGDIHTVVKRFSRDMLRPLNVIPPPDGLESLRLPSRGSNTWDTVYLTRIPSLTFRSGVGENILWKETTRQRYLGQTLCAFLTMKS